jgi:hypothetical protein
MVFRCNQERTLYLPVPSLDEIVNLKLIYSNLLIIFFFQPPRIPGQSLDLLVLYQSPKMINDMVIESAEPSPQLETGDASKSKDLS